MKLQFSDLLYSFSYGLDCVEGQLLPIAAGHGKRVARLCVILGRALGMEADELVEIAGLATLHDNALTEFIRVEFQDEDKEKLHFGGKKLGAHCVIGEKNLEKLPFALKHKNAVLYHHEEANGKGPFQKKAWETPLAAQLIHMADSLDTRFRLDNMDEEKYEKMCAYVQKMQDIRYSKECVEAFFEGVTLEALAGMEKAELFTVLSTEAGSGFKDYSNEEIHDFCNFWIKIIDYKSKFTRSHSLGVAALAEKMGKYYGYDEDKCTRLYLAGAVHDLGKLAVHSKILEKPDKLTDKEYRHIQTHAYQSWIMLKDIKGLEEETKWAVHHHEKLDGTGYPFGKNEDELGFEERLMACVDIYQALTEGRPYKEGFPHEKAISIMKEMVERRFIDKKITEDMEIFLAEKSA
ncbi:MAG: HD domain-containing protein [Lachnospiraceae bacterium]|nr:HD domain-containing protein [Lachnospiraceae bacterium]